MKLAALSFSTLFVLAAFATPFGATTVLAAPTDAARSTAACANR